jgi:hypothetical protein
MSSELYQLVHEVICLKRLNEPNFKQQPYK